MADEEKTEVKKNFLTSMFGDKDFDLDGAKVFGAITVVVGFVGFFMGKSGWETLLYTGGAMLLGKCIRENT